MGKDTVSNALLAVSYEQRSISFKKKFMRDFKQLKNKAKKVFDIAVKPFRLITSFPTDQKIRYSLTYDKICHSL